MIHAPKLSLYPWCSRPKTWYQEEKFDWAKSQCCPNVQSKPPRSSIFTRCLNSCSGAYFPNIWPRLHLTFLGLDQDCDQCTVMQINEETVLYIARVRAWAGICRVSRSMACAGYVTWCSARCGLLGTAGYCIWQYGTGLSSGSSPAQPSPAQPAPCGHQVTTEPEQCTPLCN